MADVFVSYKSEDRRRVRPIVTALEKDGYSVWWDARVAAGQEWRDRISFELDRAKCVIVAWSEGSVGPQGRFVRDEAGRAMRRGAYVPVILDRVEPPLGFGEMQAVSLIDWSGRRSSPSYRALRSTVESVLSGEPFTDETSRLAHGYSRRRLIATATAGLGALAVGGGLWWQTRRDALPPEAQRLLDDASEGVKDGGVEANSNAISKLRLASGIAPESAEIWGLLALAYAQQARMAPAAAQASLTSRGSAATKRAQALDPRQPEAAAAQILAMPLFGNWYAVERAVRAALDKHPDHPFLLLRLCELLFQVGRHQECLGSLTKVLPEISTPITVTGHVELLWNLGLFDEAESELSKAFDLWPRHFAVWFERFYYLAYNGRASEAVAFSDDTAGRPIGIPEWNFELVRSQGTAIASKSRPAFRSVLRALIDVGHRAAGFAENAALFAAFAGMTDDAFAILNGLYLDRGLTIGASWFSSEQAIYIGHERNSYILFQQQMAGVRHDRRFHDLTAEMGLDDYWRRTASRARVIE